MGEPGPKEPVNSLLQSPRGRAGGGGWEESIEGVIRGKGKSLNSAGQTSSVKPLAIFHWKGQWQYANRLLLIGDEIQKPLFPLFFNWNLPPQLGIYETNHSNDCVSHIEQESWISYITFQLWSYYEALLTPTASSKIFLDLLPLALVIQWKMHTLGYHFLIIA